MQKITSLLDINYIINNRVDLKDDKGYVIPFVRFMSYSLIQVVRLINTGNYTYNLK
jgi:hypothetical protein